MGMLVRARGLRTQPAGTHQLREFVSPCDVVLWRIQSDSRLARHNRRIDRPADGARAARVEMTAVSAHLLRRLQGLPRHGCAGLLSDSVALLLDGLQNLIHEICRIDGNTGFCDSGLGSSSPTVTDHPSELLFARAS